MDTLFNTILANTSSEITVGSTIITMLAALFLGGIIALTYRLTQDETLYQRSLAVTLFMLPVILAVIILFIGSNIARAFSLAGTLSIIRFRSNPGDSKDIGFIFFDIAAGLACGVGLYGYGVLFTAVLCAALVVLEKVNLFKPKNIQKTLKITIPEDLNYESAFDDILDKYTKKYTDLGSLFQLSYNISVGSGINDQEFINELRTRNGNLTIMLSQAPKVIK